MLLLAAGDAALTVDPMAGGRITSLEIDGRELIVPRRPRTIDWGSYPMAPFAGRLRDATLRFRGRAYRLPATEGPHAIHGTTLEQGWTVLDERTLTTDLGEPWPFRGRVTQHFDLHADGLDASMTLDAHEPMPAVLGWHPWFLRRIPVGADHAEAELDLQAREMYERGPDGLPTGRRVEPGSQPWDDCFVGVTAGPTVRWPGFLELGLTSDASHWVAYTGDADGLAVEPQTGPPDGPNIEPRVVEPGNPLTIHMAWGWRRLEA